MAKLSNQRKFDIADAMAPSFRNLAKVDRRVAFGVVINAPIRLRTGKVSTLKNRFNEDDASHITNLVLRRVYGSDRVPVEIEA
jgi:hypothetical protein